MRRFSALTAGFTRFLRGELVRSALLMRRMAPLATRFTCFFRSELVCSSFLVCRVASLTTRFARFLRGELMRSALLVGRMTAFARYLALFLLIHRSKTAPARSAGFSLATPRPFFTFFMRPRAPVGVVLALSFMLPMIFMAAFPACVGRFSLCDGSRTSPAFMAAAPVLATPVSI
jgi:hypothetical protein